VNILLVGEESAGAQALRLVAGSGHRLVGVMASPTRTSNAGGTVWQLATEFNVPRWPAERVREPDFADVIRAAKVDILLNVHSLFVLHPNVAEAPRVGSFNLHPGPLPRYAGMNAPCWAIYHGEEQHGVTIHKMRAAIDTGPICFQTLFDVSDADSGLTLSARCIKAGLELLKLLLDTAALDPTSIPLREQDLEMRTYFGREIPNGGQIDWECPARRVFNFVRAADFGPFPSPWGLPWSRFDGRDIGFRKLVLTGRRCTERPGSIAPSSCREHLLIACRDEWVAVRGVVVAGKTVPAPEVLTPGQCFSIRHDSGTFDASCSTETR
jgi:methionyl-tRNA formyltransferase